MTYQTVRSLSRVPPFHQLGDGLVVAQRPAVEPQLLEIPPRLARPAGPAGMPRISHDLVAVEIRPHPREILLGGQLVDRGVPGRRSWPAAAPRAACCGWCSRRAPACAAAAAAGPASVTYRRTAESVHFAVAVPVEPQVQVHQLRHVVDHLLGVAAAPASACATILAPDDLVMMKAHPAVGLVPAGRRLADVVQQRRPAAAPDPGSLGPPGRSPAAARSANASRRPCAGGVRRWPSASRRPRAAPHRRGRSAPSDRCRPTGFRAEQQLVQFGGHPLGGDAARVAAPSQPAPQAPAARR